MMRLFKRPKKSKRLRKRRLQVQQFEKRMLLTADMGYELYPDDYEQYDSSYVDYYGSGGGNLEEQFPGLVSLADSYISSVDGLNATLESDTQSALDGYRSAAEGAADTFENAVDGAAATLDSQLESAGDAYAATVSGLATTLDSDLQAAADQLQSDFDAAGATLESVIDSANDTFRNSAEDAAQAYNDTVVTADVTYNGSMQSAADSRASAISAANNAYNSTVAGAYNGYVSAVNGANDTLENALDNISGTTMEEYFQQMDAAYQVWYDTEDSAWQSVPPAIASASSQHAIDVAQAEQDFSDDSTDAMAAWNASVSSASATYSSEMAAAEQAYADTVDPAEATYYQEVADASETYNQDVTAANDAFNTGEAAAAATFEATADLAEDAFASTTQSAMDSFTATESGLAASAQVQMDAAGAALDSGEQGALNSFVNAATTLVGANGNQSTVDPQELNDYLEDIRTRTQRPMTDEQLEALRNEVMGKTYEYLGKEGSEKRREAFGKAKDKMIDDWETNNPTPTGQKGTWPKYRQDVINPDTDKILRKKGNRYDAHEIVPNSYGSPHQWWNITPADIKQHQGIHRSDGPFNDLFPLAQ